MTHESSIVLTASAARLLGALMEKEATTPEYYPLSLNALLNACNQRSNREPVMELDEEEVRQALRQLTEMRLAGQARGAEGRVAKYEHWLGERLNLTRAESALLCMLLLRGPQTVGELRGRTERIHRFDEIADVVAGLQRLMEREPALAGMLARQPGNKEPRYAHLLAGEIDSRSVSTGRMEAQPNPVAMDQNRDHDHDQNRIEALEAIVHKLTQEVEALRQRIDSLLG